MDHTRGHDRESSETRRFLVESDEARVVVDPGRFSDLRHGVTDLNAVVLTASKAISSTSGTAGTDARLSPSGISKSSRNASS